MAIYCIRRDGLPFVIIKLPRAKITSSGIIVHDRLRATSPRKIRKVGRAAESWGLLVEAV